MKYHRLKIVSIVLILTTLLCCLPMGVVLPVSGAEKSGSANLALGTSVSVNSVWDDPEGFWRTHFLTDGSVMTDWPLPAGETLGWRSAKHDSRDASIEITVNLSSPANLDTVILYP